VKELFPYVAFQGKGLFATEGVVTIPLQGDYVLAYRSHFYEFAREGSGSVVPSWSLRVGDVVRPILTTGNGLLRYALDDRLAVRGFESTCPKLEFLGRQSTVDLVGEKLDLDAAQAILTELRGAAIADPICLLAVKAKMPYYAILVRDHQGSVEAMRGLAEERLERFFHYKLARELGQLGPLAVVDASAHGENAYVAIARKSGLIDGDIKIESILPCAPEALVGLRIRFS
jgi:hypothetical protein